MGRPGAVGHDRRNPGHRLREGNASVPAPGPLVITRTLMRCFSPYWRGVTVGWIKAVSQLGESTAGCSVGRGGVVSGGVLDGAQVPEVGAVEDQRVGLVFLIGQSMDLQQHHLVVTGWEL